MSVLALSLVGCGADDEDFTATTTTSASGGSGNRGGAGGNGGSLGGGGLGPGGAGGQGGCGGAGPYDIVNQEPPCKVPYPGSIWTKALPDDVMSHLAAGSAEISAGTLTDGATILPEHYGRCTVSTPGPDDWANLPKYYGNASDPLYVIDDCGEHTGTFMRIPSGACFAEAQDHGLVVWDQTTDRTLALYRYGESGATCLPPCTGTIEADACHTEFSGHCGMSHWTNGPAYCDSPSPSNFGLDSLGNAPWSLHVRHRELMEGVILHPLIGLTRCTVGHVFPAQQNTWECSTSGIPEANRPPMGSLFFLDYSDEEIDAMGLPAWQEPLVRAMARYGLYISDTTNSNGSGIIVSPEGGGAYEQAGITSPIYDWLLGQGIDPVSSTENDRYHLYFLAGLPDVEIHIHLADPCVARELAGVAGGCP